MILPHDPPTCNPNNFRIVTESPPVEVVDLRLVDQQFVRAVASVRVGGVLAHGVRVVQHGGRVVVRMPERRSPDGEWLPVVVIESPALRLAIADSVLDAFRAAAPFGGLAK